MKFQFPIELADPVQIFDPANYLSFFEDLVGNGRTSGLVQNPELIAFSALNLRRYKRILKTFDFISPLDAIAGHANLKFQQWIVITEVWCGDSAQVLPVIVKIADKFGDMISLKIILRDENPEWIARYPTNGGHSIPKLISYDEEGKELFQWGPRPKEAQQILKDWKANTKGRTWADFEHDLHSWYAKDKTVSTQLELYEKLFKLVDSGNTVE